MSTAWDLTIDCAPSARAGSVLGSRTWLRRAASSRGVRELGKLGVPAGAYELPTAHAEVWSAVCSCPNDNKVTRILSLYAVVDPSAASDRKIEPLMAATAKTTNASMGKAP
jgi:hypothetical protein